MTQYAVARLAQLDEHRPLRVQAGNEELILIRQGDQVHAYQGNCPHAGAPLDEGVVCSGLLVCPWHKAAFAVDDGVVCEPPALADLRRYKAWIKGDEIWVDDQPLPVTEPPRHSDARCFVVVGAGAAGSAAVATLLA
ncbi:MAG: Rieske 2Fe-2S domain-containing protein, partial [Pseudomonas alloputida]